MPKKTKQKRNSAMNSNAMLTNGQRFADGEVFRNFFAVVDDVDPREALKHLKDMFEGKLDGDVVTMIFTECGYNVNQALENLMALSNDNQHSTSNSMAVSGNCYPLPQSPSNLFPRTKNSMPQSTTKSESNSSVASTDISVVEKEIVQEFDERKCITSTNNHDVREESKIEVLQTSIQEVHKFGSNASTEIEGLEFSTQCALVTDLKSTTQLEHKSSTIKSQFFKGPSPLKSPKSFSQFNMMYTRTVSPGIDSFLPNNAENSHEFVTPVLSIQKKYSGPLFSPTNFKSAPMSENTLLLPTARILNDDNYYAREDNSSETLFSEKKNSILKKVSNGALVLVILRGLPGSGKSTLAKQLKSSGVSLSTDDYFNVNGRYVFDGAKLSEAHEWNRKRTVNALKRQVTPIIIDNTNIETWEMIPYIKLALNYHYEIQILEPNTPWKFKPGKLAKMNRHKITREKIKRMLERYTDNKSIEKLIESYQSTYAQEGKIRLSKFCKVIPNKEFIAADETSHAESCTSSAKSSESKVAFDDDLLKKSCIHDSDNKISLEAVVHQVDESDDSETSSVNNKQTPTETFTDTNLQTELKIGNLNDLKLLVQEEAEESHSFMSQQLPSNDQEVSSWEAITELDEDFLWTTDPDPDKSDNISESCNSEVMVKLPSIYESKEIESDISRESSVSSISSTLSNFESSNPNQKSMNENFQKWSTGLYDEASHVSFSEVGTFQTHLPSYPKPQRPNVSSHHRQSSVATLEIAEGNDKGNGTVDTWETVDHVDIAKSAWESKSDSEIKATDIGDTTAPKPKRMLNNDSNFIYKSSDDSGIETADACAIHSPFKQSNENLSQSSSIYDEENSKNDWQLPIFPSSSSVDEANENSQYKPDKQKDSDNWIEPHAEIENDLSIFSLHKIVETSTNSKRSSLFDQSNVAEKSNCSQSLSIYDEKYSKNDWQLPIFPSGSSVEEVNENLHHKLNKHSLTLTDSSSQVEPSDFILLTESANKPSCISKFKTLVASTNSEKSPPFGQSNIAEKSKEIYDIPCFEKSTSTEDVFEDLNLLDKVKTLKSCFPEVCEDDLKHLLELCHGDDTWLSNILLESGYVYNNPKMEQNYSVSKSKKVNSFLGTSWLPAELPGNASSTSWEGVRTSEITDESHTQQSSNHAQMTWEEMNFMATDTYPHQSDDCVSNTWEDMNFMATDTHPHQSDDRVSNTWEEMNFMATDTYPHHSDDRVSNTWEEIKSVEKTDCSYIQPPNDCVLTSWGEESVTRDNWLWPPPDEVPYSGEDINTSTTSRSKQFDEDLNFSEQLNYNECSNDLKMTPSDNRKQSSSPSTVENALTDGQKRIMDNLTLTLNLSFTSKLEDLFGPVSDQRTGPLPSSYRKIRVDFNTAKILYDRWKEVVQSMPQLEEKTSNPVLKDRRVLSSDVRETSPALSEPRPLSEIMDMEYALQLHKEEKIKNGKNSESDMAMILKRQKLYEMFPGVDTIALDDIFEANNYSLDHTVLTLEEDIGTPTQSSVNRINMIPSPFQMKSKAGSDFLPSIAQMKQKDMSNFILEDWSNWVHQESSLVLKENSDAALESTTISSEAANFRGKAVEHYQCRQECMKKAHAAFYKGMSQLASYYAQEGSYHADKFKEANKRASELIIEERNKSLNALVLDLHGLYIKEAIPRLGKFLRMKKKDITDKVYGDTQNVTILTGRGAHSNNGAKLRPSVTKYLQSSGYKFSEVKIGVFNVNMASCP